MRDKHLQRLLARIVLSAALLLVAWPVRAAEKAAAAPDPAAARIAELESKVAELEQVLQQRNHQIAALKQPAGAESGAAPALPTPAPLVPAAPASASPASMPRATAPPTPAPPAAVPPASAPPAKDKYAFEARDEKYLFLNLGVKKSYLALERSRLLDNLRTQIPPLYEPAFSPFHGYTLPQRATRVQISNDQFTNNGNFGRDAFYNLFFDNVKVQNRHVDIDTFYGLTDDTTLRVNVPVRDSTITGDGAAFRIKPMRMTMNGHAVGVGDVTLFAKHKWWDQGQHFMNLATVFGVQLPTGKNDARFNDSQTIFMNGMPMPVSAAAGGPSVNLFSDDLRVPIASQPGTGSWGLNFGVMGTHQLTWNRFRGAVHGGALYKWFTDTKEGVRPGNEAIAAVSYVRPPTRSEKFTFDLTLLARNKQSERFPGLVMHPEADPNGMPIMDASGNLQMFITPRPPFNHGTVVFLSPALVFIPKAPIRISVAPLVRIYEPLMGPSPRFRMIFGISNTF